MGEGLLRWWSRVYYEVGAGETGAELAEMGCEDDDERGEGGRWHVEIARGTEGVMLHADYDRDDMDFDDE